MSVTRFPHRSYRGSKLHLVAPRHRAFLSNSILLVDPLTTGLLLCLCSKTNYVTSHTSAEMLRVKNVDILDLRHVSFPFYKIQSTVASKKKQDTEHVCLPPQ